MAKSFFGQIFQVEGQRFGHKFSIEAGQNLLLHRFGVNGDALSQKFLVLPNDSEGLSGSSLSATGTASFGSFSGSATSTEKPVGSAVPQSVSTDDEFGPFDWVETGFPEPLTHVFMIHGTPFRHRFGVHGDPFGHRFIVLITDASSDYSNIATSVEFPFGDGEFSSIVISSPLGDSSFDAWTFIPPYGLDVVSSNSFQQENPQGDNITFEFIVGGRLLAEFNIDHIDVPPATGVPHTLGQIFDIPYINTQDAFEHRFLTEIRTQDILESSFNVFEIHVPPAIGAGNTLGSRANVPYINTQSTLGHMWFSPINTIDVLEHEFNIDQLTAPPAAGTGNILPNRVNVPYINAVKTLGHKFFGVLLGFSKFHHLFTVPINTRDLLSHRIRVKPFRLRCKFLSLPDRQLVNTSGQKQIKFSPLRTRTIRPK